MTQWNVANASSRFKYKKVIAQQVYPFSKQAAKGLLNRPICCKVNFLLIAWWPFCTDGWFSNTTDANSLHFTAWGLTLLLGDLFALKLCVPSPFMPILCLRSIYKNSNATYTANKHANIFKSSEPATSARCPHFTFIDPAQYTPLSHGPEIRTTPKQLLNSDLHKCMYMPLACTFLWEC